jgi:predicted acetyltransferase
VTGYLVYRHAPPGAPGARSWQWDVACAELAWEDAEARDALLSFVADQAPAAHYLVWTAPQADTLGGRARMELVDSVDTTLWMTRIVDVERALELRGYPPDLDAELVLTVTDPLCERNAGSFRLAIRDGRGSVDRVTQAGPSISVRALSALYAGAMTPRRAVEAGLLTDASEADLERFGRAFGGRSPWMPDKF